MIKLPLFDEDNPPKTFGHLSTEEKMRGAKAIEDSIKRTKLLSEKQNINQTNNYDLRKV